MIDEKLRLDRYKNQIDELFNYLANKTGMVYVKETKTTYPAVLYKYIIDDYCVDYNFGIYYNGLFFKIYDDGNVSLEESYYVHNMSVEEIINLLLECIKKIKLESIKIRKNSINDDFLTDC